MTLLVEKAENGDMEWKPCLETIINMDPSNFDQEMYGMYGVSISDKDVNLLIEVGQEGVKISDDEDTNNANVSVKISSSDLAGILKVVRKNLKHFFLKNCLGKPPSPAGLLDREDQHHWRHQEADVVREDLQ